MNFGIFGTYTVSIIESCPYYRDSAISRIHPTIRDSLFSLLTTLKTTLGVHPVVNVELEYRNFKSQSFLNSCLL